MNRKNAKRLGWLMVGMAVCLTAPACRTCKDAERDTGTVSALPITNDNVIRKLETVVIPKMAFLPPATIIDAVEFFIQASRDYDDPNIPLAQRGISFMLRLPRVSTGETCDVVRPFTAATRTEYVVPEIPKLSARDIGLYDAIKLICDVTGMKMTVRRGTVCIEPIELIEDWTTRIYNLPPPPCGVCGRIHEYYQAHDMHAAASFDWKALFESLGVAWPEGCSSIKTHALTGKLQITNLPENLALIEQILDDMIEEPRQINVEMQIIAFRRANIEKLQLAGNVTQESLMALRKKGNAKLVATASAMTKSGQEAIVKATQQLSHLPERSMGNANVMVTAETLVPHDSEMRDVGMILQVVPEFLFANDPTINVMIYSEWVTLDRWETYPADVVMGRTHKQRPRRLPVLTTTCFNTQVTLENGETFLLGGSSTPDGKWVHYGFLKATLLENPDAPPNENAFKRTSLGWVPTR